MCYTLCMIKLTTFITLTLALVFSAAPASADEFAPLTRTEAIHATRVIAASYAVAFTEHAPKVTVACTKQGDRFHCRARVIADRVKLRFDATVLLRLGDDGMVVFVYAHHLRVG